MKSKISKVVMVITILIYAILNIVYIISVKGDIQCFGASMLFESIVNKNQKVLNLILFMCFMIILTVTYIIILIDNKEKAKNDNINNREKYKKVDDKTKSKNLSDKTIYKVVERNKDAKDWTKTFIFIAIISVLSGIILPNNSSDVYYYIASGRLDARYHINVFEENFKDEQAKHMDDKIIASSPACDQKFIYGAVWASICKFVGSLPTTMVITNLYAFKILNIIVHLLNCYLIYKISKNKKYVFMYGLNPLVLFEGIMNCHNDIYLVTFILLAVYLKKQEKRGLAVISLALGTLIKYVPVILLPYIILDSNEKLITDDKKLNYKYIGRITLYLVEFAIIFVGFSALVTGDVRKIVTVLAQTKVYANSIYIQLLQMGTKWDVISKLALAGKVIFCVAYAILVLISFIKGKRDAKEYMWLIIIFLSLVITNFRTWYIMWLFGIITELEDKDITKVIALSLIGEMANYIIYYLGEGWIYGGMYCITLIVAFAIFVFLQKCLSNRKLN